MLNARVAIKVDVKPEVKEKLLELTDKSGRKQTEIITYLIEKEYKEVSKRFK